LSTMPLKDENFVLNKQEFFDAVYMRYAWELKRLPERCACIPKFTAEYALSCHIGGYIMHRHNNVRDLTSQLLKEVCYDVRSKPVLLDPLKELDDLPKCAIQNPEARADISASGFWLRYQRAFFDVKVCNL